MKFPSLILFYFLFLHVMCHLEMVFAWHVPMYSPLGFHKFSLLPPPLHFFSFEWKKGMNYLRIIFCFWSSSISLLGHLLLFFIGRLPYIRFDDISEGCIIGHYGISILIYKVEFDGFTVIDNVNLIQPKPFGMGFPSEVFKHGFKFQSWVPWLELLLLLDVFFMPFSPLIQYQLCLVQDSSKQFLQFIDPKESLLLRFG